MAPQEWVREALFDDLVIQYRIRQVLHEEQTPYQKIQLVDSERYGKMLLLDGVVQTTEKDEFVYHEMLAHVPLFAHESPRRVLIIGGGDGGMLREVLRHPTVEKATMVEIDEAVIEFSRRHLPMISQGAFDDPRADVLVDDGARFIEQPGEQYDVVIVDSCDPIGPATVLFQKAFYQKIHDRLTAKGILVRQTGSTVLQPGIQRDAHEHLRQVFPWNALYVFAVPTYIGGFFSSSFSCKDSAALEISRQALAAKYDALGLATRYYNPGVHTGSFNLPEYMKGSLAI